VHFAESMHTITIMARQHWSYLSSWCVLLHQLIQSPHTQAEREVKRLTAERNEAVALSKKVAAQVRLLSHLSSSLPNVAVAVSIVDGYSECL
jgi:hypothetical protein